MRSNPIKERLKGGEAVYGTMVFEFFTPGIAQICKAAGAEFVLFDMEHSGVGIEVVKAQMAACRGIGLVPFVRVPTLQPHFIASCLDMGAVGIMVPMVETVDQARAIVNAVRYPPHGRRGAAFGIAHDDYTGGSVPEKIAAANERTMVITLIETAEGIRNVDAIAAVDGIDVLWLGHFDLTNFMGIPAQFQHADYLAAVDALTFAAKQHGKALGMMAGDTTWGHEYRAKGFNLIAYGLDLALFQRALAEGIASLKKGAAKPAIAKAARD
jgi:2-keto-3-deoxy-L-rhamnonate aldolase RhmA